MRTFARSAIGGMVVVFLFWVGFQYNDPDGLLWMAAYGAAAVEGVLFLMGRLPRTLALFYGALCAVWAAYLGVRVALAGEFIFDEQGREMMGLLICTIWTYLLVRVRDGSVRPKVSG